MRARPVSFRYGDRSRPPTRRPSRAPRARRAVHARRVTASNGLRLDHRRTPTFQPRLRHVGGPHRCRHARRWAPSAAVAERSTRWRSPASPSTPLTGPIPWVDCTGPGRSWAPPRSVPSLKPTRPLRPCDRSTPGSTAPLRRPRYSALDPHLSCGSTAPRPTASHRRGSATAQHRYQTTSPTLCGRDRRDRRSTRRVDRPQNQAELRERLISYRDLQATRETRDRSFPHRPPLPLPTERRMAPCSVRPSPCSPVSLGAC